MTVTLDEHDRTVLARLRDGDADAETLAAHAGDDPDDLRDRLADLADVGLVDRVEDGWTLLDSGARVLAASPAGTEDDRVDAPPAVRDRLADADLRRDREDAVLAAYSFLKHWGTATRAEIIDAVYGERPAGYDSPGAWWTDCVRDHLAGLPDVEPPRGDDPVWRYAETPVVERPTADGRLAAGEGVPSPQNVRFALDLLDLTADERAVVRAAFDRLLQAGEVTATALREEVYPVHDAGRETADAWWSDVVRPAFETMPGVEAADGGERWRYRPAAEGPMSSAPGADLPDGPLGPSPDDGG